MHNLNAGGKLDERRQGWLAAWSRLGLTYPNLIAVDRVAEDDSVHESLVTNSKRNAMLLQARSTCKQGIDYIIHLQSWSGSLSGGKNVLCVLEALL